MALIKVAELKQMYRTLGAKGTCRHLTESLQASARGEIGHLKPSDFSIRDLAEGLVDGGREYRNRKGHYEISLAAASLGDPEPTLGD